MKMMYALGLRLILFCFVFHLQFITASAQGFAWAHGIVSSFSGGNPSVTTSITDESNNGYFVGMFSGTADFDPGVGVQNLTAIGVLDMYILKKDAAGNFLWVKHIAALNTNSVLCFGKGIGLDSSGNIYIAGSFQDSFDFDPGVGVYPLSAHGNVHSFVLKLNPSGDFVWVKDIGSQTNIAGIGIQSMKMDRAANVFFTCVFASNPPSSIDVDPGQGVYTVQCPVEDDMLIEKLDSAGNFVWAKQISGTNVQSSLGLALDSISNVYITGQFKGTADFDPGPGVANLTSISGYDAFIAKYDSTGNYQWAGQISGGGDEVSYGIATDTFGGVIVTGSYDAGTTDFDPGPGVYNITSTSRDMFVLKLRSDGSFGWAKSIHPSGNDGGTAIATDGQGNVYTTGEYFSSADFDPGPGEYWLSGVAYVQKLDSSGNFVWARGFGGEHPLAITLDHANDIYVVGWLQNGGDFDPGPGVFNIPGGHVGFIEKLCGTSLAISADDSTICAGQNAQLTTPAITGATYTWTMNGGVIAGSGNSITVSTPGVYEVYVTGGCPNASGPLYIYDCTGVGEVANGAGVAVYPNPAHDRLNIETTLNNYTVTVLNTLGQITERRTESGRAVLDVSQYNSGVYYLRIESDGQVLNRKFVKR